MPAEFESSRANERKAVWKCQQMEKVENGRPGHANTAKSHDDSLPSQISSRRPGSVDVCEKTSVIESVLEITCISCVVLVVLKNLTERFIRLVLDEAAPVGHPAEYVIKAGNE